MYHPRLNIVLFLTICCFPLISKADSSIGVIVPLSGPLTEYGVAIEHGIDMAAKDDPQLFSNCKFLFEDSRYDPKSAVSAFQKLTNTDRISLVYNFGGPTSAALAPVTNRAKIPSLLWTSDPAATAKYEYVIRFANDANEYTEELATYLNSHDKKRLGIILTENQYLNSIMNGLRHSLRDGQTLEVLETLQPGDNDFRNILPKLKSGSYDALGVFLITGQVSQFYRQLKQYKISVPTFGTDFFESSTEIKAADGGMEGAVYANNTVSQAFADRYRSLYKNDLQLAYAGNGYDFANLACWTVANNQTAKDILRELQSHQAHTGILGDFHYVETSDGDKYFKFPIALKRINGEGVQVVPSK